MEGPISIDSFLPGKEANLTFLELLRIPLTSRGDDDGVVSGELEGLEVDGRGAAGSNVDGAAVDNIRLEGVMDVTTDLTDE